MQPFAFLFPPVACSSCHDCTESSLDAHSLPVSVEGHAGGGIRVVADEADGDERAEGMVGFRVWKGLGHDVFLLGAVGLVEYVFTAHGC